MQVSFNLCNNISLLMQAKEKSFFALYTHLSLL